LFIALLLPFFLEKNTIKILLALYYIASITRGLYSSMPAIICAIKNLFHPYDTLDCIIEKREGVFVSIFFGRTIIDAIIPFIFRMLIASIIYVVSFRYLAMPYFVQDATGMGMLDIIISSVYLPIKELIVQVF
jgi:hypothetical protein